MKKICMAIAVTISVAAGTVMAAGPWSNTVSIASVEIDPTATGTSTFLDFTSAVTGKPTACNNLSQVIFVGPADHVKAMTTLATGAFLAGRQVRIYYDGGCTVLSGVSYANVQNIRMF